MFDALKNLKDKAEEIAQSHGGAIAAGLEKVGDIVDQTTDGSTAPRSTRPSARPRILWRTWRRWTNSPYAARSRAGRGVGGQAGQDPQDVVALEQGVLSAGDGFEGDEGLARGGQPMPKIVLRAAGRPEPAVVPRQHRLVHNLPRLPPAHVHELPGQRAADQLDIHVPRPRARLRTIPVRPNTHRSHHAASTHPPPVPGEHPRAGSPIRPDRMSRPRTTRCRGGS
ncbi:antitoxin [Streptomyces sp. NPDC127069]|uniref:antitoxin n=1 Tax=Streptomyces sp. NPDC127069 TaxID=3347128 RepID=UPI00365C65B3